MSALRLRLERDASARLLGFLTAITVAAAAIGWLIAHGHGLLVIASVLGLAGLALLTRINSGVALALLVLAALNGLPLLALSAIAQEVAVVALMVLLSVKWLNRPRSSMAGETMGFTSAWCGLLLGLCAFAVVRASDRGVPLLSALLFGKQYIYFALLVPIGVGGLWRRDDMAWFGGILLLGAIAGGVGELLTTAHSGLGTALLHPVSVVARSTGFTRAYAPISDLTTFGLLFGLTSLLLLPDRRIRALVLAMTFVCAVGVALEQSRAVYVAVVGGVGVTVGLLTITRSRIGHRFRRYVVVSVAALAAAALVVGFVAPGFVHTYVTNPVSVRLAQGLTPGSDTSGNIVLRLSAAKDMMAVLGGHWPLGLGFLDPRYVAFAGLPHGSISDTDLGVVNIVMTLGVVGGIIYLMPLFVALARLSSYIVRSGYLGDPWLDAAAVGVFASILTLLLGSPTLVTLFTGGGAVLAAMVVAAGLNLTGPLGGGKRG